MGSWEACRTRLAWGALLSLAGLAPACGARGAAASDAGADRPSGMIGDPDLSHDGAVEAGGGRGGSRGVGGSSSGAAGVGGSGGAVGVGGSGAGAGGAAGAGGGPPTPATTIEACRLLGIGHVLSMDLSPDGALVAYGSVEGGVTLIGVADFVVRRTITAHASPVTAVAFSPDSSRIASADARGNVALWTVAGGGPVWSAPPLDGPLAGLAWSVPGTLWALTAGGLYPIDGGTGTHPIAAASSTTGAAALAVSPDGQTIALGDTDGGVRLLAAASLSVTASIKAAHPGGVSALRVSRDGQKLVTGGADGTTALWDLQGNPLVRVAQPGAPVTSVDVNADGSLLAAGEDTSPSVRAFRPDGTVLADYIIYPSSTRLSFDEKYLISMSAGIRADRDPVDTTQTGASREWDDLAVAAAFSPDGRYVAESVFDNVRLWDTQTGQMVRLLDTTPPIYTPAEGIAFSPDGSVLARNDGNRNLYLLRTADSALLAMHTGVADSYAVVYSPDGQWLATTGPASVLLWRISDGSSGPTGLVGSGGKAPTAVAFSPDGQTLAVGDGAGNVVLWPFPSGAVPVTFAAVRQAVQRISFSPDGTRLIVSDGYDPAALFKPDGTKIATSSDVLSTQAAFSGDGAYLATNAQGPEIPGPNGFTFPVPEVLLSSPVTGAPLAAYWWVTNVGNLFYTLGGVVAFAPHDHRLLLGGELGTILCLP